MATDIVVRILGFPVSMENTNALQQHALLSLPSPSVAKYRPQRSLLSELLSAASLSSAETVTETDTDTEDDPYSSDGEDDLRPEEEAFISEASCSPYKRRRSSSPVCIPIAP